MDAIVVKIVVRTRRSLGCPHWRKCLGWGRPDIYEVAKDGSVYVLGSTRSADFPTTADAIQRRFGGPDRNVFLLRLDPNGKIVYSTLLGRAKNDEATGLAVADDGTVYIGGVTMSATSLRRACKSVWPRRTAGCVHRPIATGRSEESADRLARRQGCRSHSPVWHSTGPEISSLPALRRPAISP